MAWTWAAFASSVSFFRVVNTHVCLLITSHADWTQMRFIAKPKRGVYVHAFEQPNKKHETIRARSNWTPLTPLPWAPLAQQSRCYPRAWSSPNHWAGHTRNLMQHRKHCLMQLLQICPFSSPGFESCLPQTSSEPFPSIVYSSSGLTSNPSQLSADAASMHWRPASIPECDLPNQSG